MSRPMCAQRWPGRSRPFPRSSRIAAPPDAPPRLPPRHAKPWRSCRGGSAEVTRTVTVSSAASAMNTRAAKVSRFIGLARGRHGRRTVGHVASDSRCTRLDRLNFQEPFGRDTHSTLAFLCGWSCGQKSVGFARGVELRCVTGGLAVDQTARALSVGAYHPIAHDLQRHPAMSVRSGTGVVIANLLTSRHLESHRSISGKPQRVKALR